MTPLTISKVVLSEDEKRVYQIPWEQQQERIVDNKNKHEDKGKDSQCLCLCCVYTCGKAKFTQYSFVKIEINRRYQAFSHPTMSSVKLLYTSPGF